MSTETLPNTTLYYRDGTSDKVYQCNIEAKGAGYVVNFTYGRRGSSLKAGSKTTSPVDLVAATKIFEKLLSEKTSKGYTPGEDGTPYTQSEHANKPTGYVPQLLVSIDEVEALELLRNPAFILQEKKDGERTIISVKDGVVISANKKGLYKSICKPIEEAILSLKLDLTVDAESIGDIAYIFDVLEIESEDLRSKGYEERIAELKKLNKLLLKKKITALEVVPTAETTAEKVALFEQLQAAKKEGVVYKRKDAPYVSGRPASGGSQLKYKFYATASVYVNKVNDKRSVAMQVYDAATSTWLDVGNVTISPDKEIPAVGAIIEVRYLYAYKGGSLFQTIYLGPRNDVDKDECVVEQLKYKSED